MLIKHATFEVIEAKFAQEGDDLIKTAHKHVFDYEPRPGYLYVRSRAISSRTNDNFDNFPAEEIEKGWSTFIGKPVFVNHHNDDHRRARGVIIDAVLHEDHLPKTGEADTWVEVLMEVDAIRFPKLAEAIIKGEIERTSMGTDVAYSICSVCNNKASSPVEYCKHIPKMKGMKVERTTASGEKEQTLVYEKCYGLSFFENSLLVEEPADPTALMLGVDERGLAMTGYVTTVEGHKALAAVAARSGKWVKTASKVGYGETVAPTKVDTLREEFCPVCGESDSFDGDTCKVCQYVAPPKEFLDPDLEKAKEIDLLQEDDEEGVELDENGQEIPEGEDGQEFTEDGEPIEGEDGEVLDGEEDGELELPEGVDEQEEVTEEELDVSDIDAEFDDLDAESDDEADAEEVPGDGDEEADIEEASEDGDDGDKVGDDKITSEDEDDGDDEDEDEDEDDEEGSDDDTTPSFMKKKKKSRLVSRERTGGNLNMSATLKILASQERKIRELQSAFAFIARLAGLEGHPKAAALIKEAEENPGSTGWAGTDDTPGGEAPSSTSEETLGDVKNDQVGGGSATDDVEAIGDTSEADVSADATDDVGSAKPVLDEPLDLNEKSVEVPVAGIGDLGEGPRGQPGSGRTETEVRVDDSETGAKNPNPAFPEQFTSSTDQSEGRFIASLRLARLQIQAGIGEGEDLVLANTIAHGDMTDGQIQHDIETLASVIQASKKSARRTVPRHLVPTKVQAGRSVPSLASEQPIQSVASGPSDDEFLFE